MVAEIAVEFPSNTKVFFRKLKSNFVPKPLHSWKNTGNTVGTGKFTKRLSVEDSHVVWLFLFFFNFNFFFLSNKQQKYKYKYTLIQLQLVNAIAPNENIKITYINKSMKIK